MIISSSTQICRQGATEGGALGGFFTFGGADIFGISNNHVLANFNNCAVGDKICMAGSGIVIGSLQYWVRLNDINNYLDIALFKLDPGIFPRWKILGNTVYPHSIRRGVDGEKVYMLKNDGSFKEGMISTLFIDEPINFSFSNKDFPFTGLTEIEPINGEPFSIEGESGSLIFSEGHDILGVLIGSLIDGSKSYYVPFVNGKVGIKALYNLQFWRP